MSSKHVKNSNNDGDDVSDYKNGVTALIVAAFNGNNTRVKELIDTGVNVNEADHFCGTALMAAAS